MRVDDDDEAGGDATAISCSSIESSTVKRARSGGGNDEGGEDVDDVDASTLVLSVCLMLASALLLPSKLQCIHPASLRTRRVRDKR